MYQHANMDDTWDNPPQWMKNTFPDGCSFSTPKFFPNQTKYATVRIWRGQENTASFQAWLSVVEYKHGHYSKPKSVYWEKGEHART